MTVVNLGKKLEVAVMTGNENGNIEQHIQQDKKSETKKNPLMTVQTSSIPTKIEFAEDKSKRNPQNGENSNGE